MFVGFVGFFFLPFPFCCLGLALVGSPRSFGFLFFLSFLSSLLFTLHKITQHKQNNNTNKAKAPTTKTQHTNTKECHFFLLLFSCMCILFGVLYPPPMVGSSVFRSVEGTALWASKQLVACMAALPCCHPTPPYSDLTVTSSRPHTSYTTVVPECPVVVWGGPVCGVCVRSGVVVVCLLAPLRLMVLCPFAAFCCFGHAYSA